MKHARHRDFKEGIQLRDRMKAVVEAEDPRNPISDRELAERFGISCPLTRYHRIRAGIPPAHKRLASIDLAVQGRTPQRAAKGE